MPEKSGKHTTNNRKSSGKEPIHIDQIIRTRRRSVGLKITEDARLIVRAPLRMSLAGIQSIVEKKRNWVEKKTDEIKRRNREKPQRRFVRGETFPYRGKQIPLRVTDKYQGLVLKDSMFFISEKFEGNRVVAEKLFEDFYIGEARRILVKRTAEIARSLGLKTGKVRISRAKKRFGSCSSSGNINLSWRIILAPPEISDYVIVHELAHLVEQNHSKSFWRVVGKMMPDYERRKKWIRENSHLLKI